MWKPEHRAAADRRGLRYESDLTDAEWALVGSLIPPAKRGGRPRTVNVREVLNAIFYQRPWFVTHGDSVFWAELIPWRGEDSRHASSGERSEGFLGR